MAVRLENTVLDFKSLQLKAAGGKWDGNGLGEANKANQGSYLEYDFILFILNFFLSIIKNSFVSRDFDKIIFTFTIHIFLIAFEQMFSSSNFLNY